MLEEFTKGITEIVDPYPKFLEHIHWVLKVDWYIQSNLKV